MEMYKVNNSKVVVGAGYDPVNRVLRLQLRNQPDHYYDYLDVPPNDYADLFEVDNAGMYYNKNIKFHYGSRKVLIADTVDTKMDVKSNISLDDFAELLVQKVVARLVKKLS